jgi:chemotaxis protein methyltransferase CheR
VDRNGESFYQADESLRRMITFARLNLAKPPFPMKGPLDVIFCRNVMIYFNTSDRKKIYYEISKILEPDGYLLIGSTESLVNDTDLYVSKKYLNAILYQFKHYSEG